VAAGAQVEQDEADHGGDKYGHGKMIELQPEAPGGAGLGVHHFEFDECHGGGAEGEEGKGEAGPFIALGEPCEEMDGCEGRAGGGEHRPDDVDPRHCSRSSMFNRVDGSVPL